MQQEYVCEFLKESESLVDSIQTDTQPIIKFYTEENTWLLKSVFRKIEELSIII